MKKWLDTDHLSLLVILVALTAPILRYAVAFQQAEPPLVAWGLVLDISPLTGVAFGISYEAAAFLGLREAVAARKRKLKTWWWPLAGSLGQMVLGTFIVSPVLTSEMRGVSLNTLLDTWGCGLWAVTVAAAPLFCSLTVALVLAVQKKERIAQTTKTAQTAEADTETITGIAQVTVAPSDNGRDRPYKICSLCGFTAQSPQAWAGHCKGAQHKRRVAETAPVLTEL